MTDARILDRGYRKYDGTRSGVPGAVRSVAWHTTRSILGLGRPARHKIFPVIVLAIAFLPAIVFVGLSILIGDFGDLRPEYWELFARSIVSSLLFASMVAPEAIVRDRRDGMYALYLSTPLTRPTYLLAKVVSVMGCLVLITAGPPVLLLFGYTAQSQGPSGLGAWLGVGLRLLLAGVLMSALYTAVTLAASSMTDRRAFASVASVMVVFGGLTAGGALVEGAGLAPEFWLLSPANTALEIAPRLFGARSDEFRTVSTAVVALGVAAWTVAGSAVVALRYRRLAAI